MRIAYRPRQGQLRVTVPYFADDSEFRTWNAGEERDVPDDLKVPFNVSNNSRLAREGTVEQGAVRGAVRDVSAVDAVLSIGPDFVDASTGVNPDYACVECGRESTELYFHDPGLAVPGMAIDADSGPETRVWYTTDGTVNGDKLCAEDFLARNPRYLPWLESCGLSPETSENARRKAAEAEAKAGAGKTPPAGSPPHQVTDAARTAAGEADHD